MFFNKSIITTAAVVMMMFNMESVYTHSEEQRGGAITEMATSVRVKENIFLVSKTAQLFLWSPLKPLLGKR